MACDRAPGLYGSTFRLYSDAEAGGEMREDHRDQDPGVTIVNPR